MVDLTRGPHPIARLLDRAPGRSGSAYRDWLDERGEAFRKRVEIATLDPFRGCKNAIDDQLVDAVCACWTPSTSSSSPALRSMTFAAHPDHVAVEVAYHCAQDVHEVFHQPTLTRGRRLAEQLIEKLPSCPISEIARLGKTLRRWRTAFLAYFDTDGLDASPHTEL